MREQARRQQEESLRQQRLEDERRREREREELRKRRERVHVCLNVLTTQLLFGRPVCIFRVVYLPSVGVVAFR